LDTGEEFDGWLHGRKADGLYVALDPQESSIRFVPEGRYSSIDYLQKATRAEFAEFVSVQREEVKALASDLEQPMRHALDQLDYNHNRRIVSTLHSSKEVLHIPDALLLERLLATRAAYKGLLDEAERSGVAQVLRERQEQLRRVMSRLILPEIDFEWASPDEIDEMILRVRESKLLGEDFGRSELDKLTGTVISEVLKEGELKRPADRPRRHRVRDKHGWLQKWRKVALGAGLAATNLALGGVAVLAYIPTFGQVDLPSALAIAGSMYRGLSDARNSLHQVNASIEDE